MIVRVRLFGQASVSCTWPQVEQASYHSTNLVSRYPTSLGFRSYCYIAPRTDKGEVHYWKIAIHLLMSSRTDLRHRFKIIPYSKNCDVHLN